MQQPQEDPFVAAAVNRLQDQFVVEMCNSPTPEESEAWYTSHRNTDWTCIACIKNNVKCTFQPPNFLSCQSCTAWGVTCSAKLDELHSRVKRKLNLDHLAFSSLHKKTLEARKAYMKRLIDAPENVDAQSSADISMSNDNSTPNRSQPAPSGFHIAAVPTPMTTSASPRTLAASPPVAISLPSAARRSISITNPSDQIRAHTSVDPTPVVSGPGMVREELYNESREENRRLKEQLAASEARNRELEESLKAAANGTELLTLTKTVKDLSESFADIKVKNRILSQRVKELVSQDTEFIQKELLEHANIHVLIRLLALARSDFAARKLSRAQMLQTLDNLSGQLHEVADRRLERAPVGFGSIQEVMLPLRRHALAPDDVDAFDDSLVKSEEGSSTEPSPKRQKVAVTADTAEEQNLNS